MTWRSRRKKEIPIEEAVEAAMKDATSWWLGQKPIFIVFSHDGNAHFNFLKPEYTTKTWLFVFLDPMDYSGQRLLQCIDEFNRRLSICGFSFLMVLCPRYQQLFSGTDGERAIQQQIIRRFHIGFPVTIDGKLLVSTLFKASYPHVSILSAGKLTFKMSGDKIFTDLEAELQKLVRLTDPGVPFPNTFSAGKGHPNGATLSAVEFGQGNSIAVTAQFLGEVEFEEGGPEGFTVGFFPTDGPKSLKGVAPQEVLLQGKWLRDQERLLTADPRSSITVECQGSHMALVGHSVPKNRRSKDAVEMVAGDVFIEVNGTNPSEAQIGEGASLRFDGRAVVKVSRSGFYPLLANLPEGKRTVTLRFDSADEVPLAIYGVRFGGT